MAELTKLLGFMSSWDRQAVLDEYAAKFENCTDFDALAESLGSPTRVAIALAREYVPSPPPKPAASAADKPASEERTEAPAAAPSSPAAAAVPLPDEFAEPAQPEVRKSAKRPKPSGGSVALCVVLGLVIALPVTVALLLIGIPFLIVGVVVIGAAVCAVMQVFPALGLISDILLVLGGGLTAAALGLLFAAFGLWLSLTLGGLWLEKAVFPVGRRICRKKEVPDA